MEAFTLQSGRELRQYLWPIGAAGLLAIEAALHVAVGPGAALTVYSLVSPFLLLLLATAISIANAAHRTLGSRPFWAFLAAGYGLWAVDRWIWIYYRIGLHTPIPDSSVADPSLFLHVVPFMAALATLPHSTQSKARSYRTTVSFLLLLFFWIFLYAFLLFPYQLHVLSLLPYQFLDPNVYNLRYDHLYLGENLVLVLALSFLALRARPPWGSVYRNLLGASLLYAVSSYAKNVALDTGHYYPGNLYDMAEFASVCWLVWVPLRARQLAPQLEQGTESGSDGRAITSLPAKLVVLAIPLIGIWELFRREMPPELQRYRLFVVLLFILLLGISAFLEDYLTKRELLQNVSKNRFFRTIFENAQIGISFFSVDGREFSCNRAMREMLGYTEKELSRLEQWDNITHPDERASSAERYAELLQAKREQDEYEQRFIRRDGGIVAARGRFSLLRDAVGKPQYVVALTEDITERRQAEEDLRRANFLAETALELTKAGYWHVPLDGSGWYNSSPRRVAIFGDIPNPEYRYRIEDVFARAGEADEAAAQDAQEAFNAAVEGNTDIYDSVYAYKRPIDGRIAWVHALGHILRDADGKPTDMYGVSQDISESKRLEAELVTSKEAAEAATRSKSDFLANMSHEIRTPMNAILGMTHLALKTDLTSKQRDYLTKTKAAAQSLLGIINDILDFSKIEAGKLDMEKTDFRLEDVLENVSSVVSQKAHDKNLEFLMAAQQDLPLNLVGDPLRLGQILINLVNNAVKFTERGEIVVTVKLEERVSDQVKLKFAIRDSGIGMTPEQTARLFQAFSQADSSTTRRYGGTGLGLSISKRFVEMMEGNIWVDSEYRRGSTFYFTAWFGLGSAERRQKALPPELTGVRALVVDDNATGREILTEMLRKFTFRVESVSSGKEALWELANADTQDPYRLVLMDSQMPGLDGLETSRRIKRGSDLRNLPKILMISEFNREELHRQELEVEGVLQKPVSPSILFDTLLSLFVAAREEKAPASAGISDRNLPLASGIRVLLVEDNEVNQQVATELLESEGAKVTIANHGAEAVKILTQGNQPPPFDVVLMDLQMPEMDGVTAARLLRARPHLQQLPIIAMTAHVMAEEVQRCLEAGMNDHVGKPIEPGAFFATLARWTCAHQREIAEVPARAAGTGDEITLPEIEGVDVASGLRRVAGNKRLYRDLLAQFAVKQKSAGERIASAIESGDRHQAERLAHSLKGAAGNLGIKKIFRLAGNLEKAISESLDGVEGMVNELASALDRQIQAIEEGLKVSTPIAGKRDAAGSGDPFAVSAAVARLRESLEASDADAPDAYATLVELLGGTVDPSRLEALSAAVNAFDFETALVKLNEIAKQYGAIQK